MNPNRKSLIRRLSANKRGAVLPLMAFGILAFCGFSALVVDVGYLYYAKRALQASTEAAALAGAQDINCCSTGGRALTTATSYSSVTGDRNALPNVTASMTSGYPALRCFTSTGVPCSSPDNANGIVVKQQATVPLFFAKVLGFSSVQVATTAAAGRAGGVGHPVDVMIILDTTASMNSADGSCSGATRLNCAFSGVRALISGFQTSSAHVGLMVFPGLTTAANAALEYDCSSTTPANSAIASYGASPVYTVVGLSSDYKNANGTLNTASNLVKAARGGASGCTAGITAYGGVGTFYADAITTAQNYLTANGRANTQKMIIMLSDGDASASSSNMPSGRSTNQCHQAITAAQTATTAGTTVITIAYGASTSSSGSCSTDTTHISACSTLQQMASDSSRFYSDTTGGSSTCTSSAHSVTDLSAIFQDIGTSLVGSRLLPDSTT
jgi:hypothetical protein